MTTIELDKPLIDLAGIVIPGDTQGQLVSKCLANSTTGNPMKFWDWAKVLFKNEPLKLDTSDVDTLTKFVLECQQLTTLSKAQIIITIKAGEQS